MADPSLALQGAIVAALKSGTPVAGGRVYDRVPGPPPTFPYVSVGNWQVVGDNNDCFNASEVFAVMDVWSRAVGKPEARQIAATVRDRMIQPLSLPGFQITEIDPNTSIIDVGDPDGLTTHLRVEVRYLIDHDT